jgi:hypothetical protein
VRQVPLGRAGIGMDCTHWSSATAARPGPGCARARCAKRSPARTRLRRRGSGDGRGWVHGHASRLQVGQRARCDRAAMWKVPAVSLQHKGRIGVRRVTRVRAAPHRSRRWRHWPQRLGLSSTRTNSTGSSQADHRAQFCFHLRTWPGGT